jgi:hypothetical protein
VSGRLWASLSVAWALACSTPAPIVPPDPQGVQPARILADGLAVTAIDGYASFERYSFRDGGLVLPGRTLKFLIDRRDPAKPVVYFMNQNFTDASGTRPESAKYHFPLAERVLPDFTETLKSFGAVTYDTLDKRYVAGSIQTYFVDGASEPLFGVQFFPQDVVRDGLVVEVVRALLPQLRLPNARFAFVATGIQQTLRERDVRELEALGAPAKSLDEVLGAIDYIPLNRGTALGFLRVFPEDHDALSPLDIAVFDELPLDLSVVAGTITKDYQDPTSHVNLKSKERGTPNMVLRSASASAGELSRWRDRPVRLTVQVDGFRIEAATEEEVRAHHAKRSAAPWVALPYRASSELPSYAEMCPEDPADCLALSSVFGGKAASLGFLNQRDVLGRVTHEGSLSHAYGYDIAPAGLGVPFKLYKDFVEYPANTELRGAIADLVVAIKRGDLAPKELSRRAERVRGLFLSATFPPGSVERVAKRIGAVLPGVPKVKVRSSANAEDMPNFDGAGLYASFAANLTKPEEPDSPCVVVSDGVKSKVKPKTLGCAMKAVFASTWNKRAIEERTFARLDHATALMGFAIVADYELEEPVAANAVVVTRVLATPNVYGYTFALQRGNVLVTNPEPGTLAESTIAAFNEPGEAPSFAVTRFATPVAGQPPLRSPVLSDTKLRELVEITRTAEVAYCRARPDYYEHDCRYAPADPTKTRALDFELKVLDSGRFVCKQMREFSGR